MRAAVVAAMCFAAACGEPSIDDPAAFLAQVPVAECERLVRCGTFDTVDHCRAYEVAWHHRERIPITSPLFGDAPWIDAVERGTVVYSPTEAAACVAGTRERSCSYFDRLPLEACAHVFTGTRKDGEDADFWGECASRRKDSELCGLLELCCPSPCVPSPALEAPELGERCTDICAQGLRCRGGRCVRGPGPGETCVVDWECPEHHICAYGPDGGRCLDPRRTGDFCFGGGGTSDNPPLCNDLGSGCGADLRCHRYGFEGEVCDDTKDLCGPGLFCDQVVGRCVGFVAAEQRCMQWTNGPYCDRGLYCDRSGRLFEAVCRPLLLDGEPCRSDESCTSGRCDDERCVTILACD